MAGRRIRTSPAGGILSRQVHVSFANSSAQYTRGRQEDLWCVQNTVLPKCPNLNNDCLCSSKMDD